MANFNTHLTVAAAASGLIATLVYKMELVSVPDALLLVLSGTVGGILPDIDLKYSYPSKLLFSLLGTLTALLWVFSSEIELSILELWVVGLGIFLLIRYPLWLCFHKLAVHRGSVHSVAAAMLAAFLTSSLCFNLFARTEFVSWLAGLTMFLGFVLHLLLDEIYSVDFMGVRIKRSFGSAFKLIDTQHIIGSCVILILAMASWFYTPSATQFVATLSAHETQAQLIAALIPDWLPALLKR